MLSWKKTHIGSEIEGLDLVVGILVQHYPNLQAVAQKLSGGNSVVEKQMVDYGKACIATVL